MPAGIGSPFKVVSDSIIAIFNAEFAAEGFVMRKDSLHGSNGRKRVDVGIAPAEEVPNARNMSALEVWVEVKFYDQYRDSRDPDLIVNPERITEFAERFRRAMHAGGMATPGTNAVWYFDVMRVRYPNDPTGNKTRFVATIRAFGDNTALNETRG